MDKRVFQILKLIEDNKKEAYIVGGYVRDYLLNIESNDYDICTNCHLDTLCQIISKRYDYTIKLGTMFIKIDNISIEITPYRKEEEYQKRKPSKLYPVNTLYEDLLRRDFTINTICMNKDGEIIDLLNGYEDLKQHKLKIVGDVDKKLIEDPLRILRSVRFSLKYDLGLDENLKLGINKYAKLITTLSITRKREEIDKLIDLKLLDKISIYHIDQYLNIDLNSIKYYNNKLLTWLLIDPNNYYVQNKKEEKLINSVRYLSTHISDYNLYVYGLDIVKLVSELNDTDLISRYNNLPIKSRKDINITSYDIMEVTKTNINEVYQKIEFQIIDGNLENTRESIIDYISR